MNDVIASKDKVVGSEDNLASSEDKAKASRSVGLVSIAIVNNLESADTLVSLVKRAPHAEALAPFTITAAFLSELAADIAECRSLLGIVTDQKAERTVITKTEMTSKTALLMILQRVQSAALIESAGRPVSGWYIGTNLSVQSRAMLEQIAAAIADKLETHTPVGLPADMSVKVRAALTAWNTADADQGASLTSSKQRRATAMTIYNSINDRRYQILLAADAAYPHREKTNAPIRADFSIPKTRPYRPKR
jgi:hypothetical protein